MPSGSAQYLYLNTRVPALAAPAVRRGIALAIDRQAIVDGIMGGHNTVGRSVVTPVHRSDGALLGFALGLLFRNSPAAIVGYFVVNLVLPGLSGALASSQQWWADNSGWFDVNESRFLLFDSTLTGTEWAQLGVTSALWILLPLLVGLRLVLRSEVK